MKCHYLTILALFLSLIMMVEGNTATPSDIGVFPSTSTETIASPVYELRSTTIWILVVGFILAFTLSFGVGANDVANVFGTSVGSKVLTLRQACLIATVAEIMGSILLVGANDVANSFGTSVGSGVLTLRKACILATIFETMGAIFIGYKVSDTVRKGILDVSLYNNSEKELMLGSVAALGGSSLWNIVATFLKLPISGTHTIVGATVGFTLCARGFSGVNWITFSKIVASWFVSPLLSGFMSAVLYIAIRHFILKKDKPLEPGLKSLPLFYGVTILVNVFSIVHDGPSLLYLDNLPWWGSIVISLGVGLLVAIIVQAIVVPRQRKKITDGFNAFDAQNSKVKFTIGSAVNHSRSPTPPTDVCQIEKGAIPQMTPSTLPLLSPENNGYMPVPNKPSELSLISNSSNKTGNGFNGLTSNNSQLPLVNQSCTKEELKEADEEDSYEVKKLFSFLQILTATFGSFAHGGNDVSNAIGPLIALWAIYTEGSVAQKSETPLYILLYGGIGISVGLWVWGRRVIQTIGENLTKVTPSSGFTIEIGSAFTVLLASKIGLPISTTHCKVGSVVFVGWTKSTKRGVDWKLFRNIVIAWVVTVPLTAGISGLLMVIFRSAFL